MKKTLAAVAILGAFAGSALADVTLYGIVDEGLAFTHSENVKGEKADTWGLESGIGAASRIGLKGAEKLSEDVTVGFQLEKGINVDTGDEASKDKFFNRGAYMYVKSSYGQLTAGYQGLINSGNGPHGMLGGGTTGLGGGWMDVGSIGSSFLGRQGARAENAITYASPVFAGAQVLTQVALGSKDEATHHADRVYNVAVKYGVGALNTGVIFTVDDEGHSKDAPKKGKDAKIVSAYANYDFDVVKVYVAGQYFKDFNKEMIKQGDQPVGATEEYSGSKDYKGYGMSLAAAAPIMGGTLTAGVHFGEAEQVKASAYKRETIGGAAYYEYPLSKMTAVYGLAGYEKAEYKDTKDLETSKFQAAIGMTHKF